MAGQGARRDRVQDLPVRHESLLSTTTRELPSRSALAIPCGT